MIHWRSSSIFSWPVILQSSWSHPLPQKAPLWMLEPTGTWHPFTGGLWAGWHSVDAWVAWPKILSYDAWPQMTIGFVFLFLQEMSWRLLVGWQMSWRLTWFGLLILTNFSSFRLNTTLSNSVGADQFSATFSREDEVRPWNEKRSFLFWEACPQKRNHNF